jgi:peptidyl-prolyl cis-trans isomerase C
LLPLEEGDKDMIPIIARHLVAVAATSVVLTSAASFVVAAAAAKDDNDARYQSKPFYLRDIRIGDTMLPFSPVTVVITIFSLIMLSGLFSWNKISATASHILLLDDDAEAKLNKIKKDIGNDYTKFQMAAKQYSKCPSGKSSGGSLGSFRPGMMVPAFDRVIFAKETKVREVIGPIQTNFGWHLIWIEDRTLLE